MGFQFNRRVNLGRGWSLTNQGTLSFRTKTGSISTAGGSIRTGIPGLVYRWRMPKGGGGIGLLITYIMLHIVAIAVAIWLVLKIIQLVIIALPIVWELLKWMALTTYDFAQYVKAQYAERKKHKLPTQIE
jgi:hypothetical protein